MKKSSAIFTSVPQNKPQRNHFDLSHEVKMSGKFGYLMPMLVQECLPGDQMSDQCTVFLRAAPLLSPVMHRLTVKTNFFFVPNRIICDSWQDFITGGQDGTDAPVLPYISMEALFAIGGAAPIAMELSSLWDYLGLPPSEAEPVGGYSNEQISVFPFRACAKIWNDFFRDPNFDIELDLDTEVDGDVTIASFNAGLFTLRQRGWRKDYFTSALPFAQRGAEVLMPLAGTGSVTYRPAGEIVPGDPNTALGVGPTDLLVSDFGGTPQNVNIHNIDEVLIDASSVSINDLRRAIALQRWLEANARGGARYTEQILSHFNQTVPDFRLQRAEYLGGGSQVIRISEVLATAESTGVDVGDMKGHGISVGKSNRFSYRAPEHGFVIGFVSVLPDSAYSQGLDRFWTRRSKFEFAWPLLANLGEQEILSKEIFFSPDQADFDENQATFGYIPRFAEYKFRNDRIAGDFRDTLGFWHESRFFTVRPVLGSAFTTFQEDGGSPANSLEETFRRIFAVQDGTDYLWMQIFHNLHAKRPLPFFGVPSL